MELISKLSISRLLISQVDSILDSLEAKFDEMSSQILSRSTSVPPCAVTSVLIFFSVEQMSTRVDALETSIQDIINGDFSMTSTSLPQSPGPGTPGIQK